GAGGEGKSTIVMQAAALLGANHGWRVLHPFTRGSPFEPEWLTSFERPDRPILIVADNGDQHLDLLDQIDLGMAAGHPVHVHLAVAARERDWDSAVDAWRKRHRRPPGGGGVLRLARYAVPPFSRDLAVSIITS